MWATLIAALLAWQVGVEKETPAKDVEIPAQARSDDLWLVDAERAIDEARFVDAIMALQSARRAGASDERMDPMEARLRQALEVKLPWATVSSVEAPASSSAAAIEGNTSEWNTAFRR